MKTITTPLLRAFGFRPVLVGNGIAVAASIGACGLLNTRASVLAVDAAVFVAGAARSIEFTGINTLTFADIGPHDRSSASTFFSMMQQVSIALGVAVAAIALHLAHGAGSSGLTQADFTVAFALTAAVALVGALLMLRLRPDAGQAITDHPPRNQRPRAARSEGPHATAPARTTLSADPLRRRQPEPQVAWQPVVHELTGNGGGQGKCREWSIEYATSAVRTSATAGVARGPGRAHEPAPA
jgi:MFS family permease